jgi:hypothetical protein
MALTSWFAFPSDSVQIVAALSHFPAVAAAKRIVVALYLLYLELDEYQIGQNGELGIPCRENRLGRASG